MRPCAAFGDAFTETVRVEGWTTSSFSENAWISDWCGDKSLHNTPYDNILST